MEVKEQGKDIIGKKEQKRWRKTRFMLAKVIHRISKRLLGSPKVAVIHTMDKSNSVIERVIGQKVDRIGNGSYGISNTRRRWKVSLGESLT